MRALNQQVQRLRTRLLAQAYTQPAPDARALVLGGLVCGSVAPQLAADLAAAVPGLALRSDALQPVEEGLDLRGRSQLLEQAARWLVQTGLVSAWRDELLDVQADEGQGPVLARVDRCAVRALGITTQSVRLNGYAADGRLFVARRAAAKRVDRLWDNLAGGIISSGETLQGALVRETLEEAGIDISGRSLQARAHLRVRRNLADGVLSEIVHVFELDLAPGTVAVNRDGEVERFEIWDIPTVLGAIGRREFTIEASLATLESLLHRV